MQVFYGSGKSYIIKYFVQIGHGGSEYSKIDEVLMTVQSNLSNIVPTVSRNIRSLSIIRRYYKNIFLRERRIILKLWISVLIIVFKRIRRLSLSQPDKSRPHHQVPVSLRSILILSTNVRRQTPPVGPLLSDFPTKTLFAFHSIPYVQNYVPTSFLC